jgi:carbonic anhydrase
MELQATYLIIGIVGFSIVLVVVIMGISYQAEKARRAALQQLAITLSFRFNPTGSGELLNYLPDFPIYSRGHTKKIKNQLDGKYRDCQVSFFDYTYVIGYGKSRHSYRQSIVAVRSEQAAFPKFSLGPESFFNTLGKIFGAKDINFEDAPEFSKRYFLKCEKETEIRSLFSPRVLTYFTDNPGLCVEGYQNVLLFYRKNHRVLPEEVEQFLAKGWETLKIFYPHPF